MFLSCRTSNGWQKIVCHELQRLAVKRLSYSKRFRISNFEFRILEPEYFKKTFAQKITETQNWNRDHAGVADSLFQL